MEKLAWPVRQRLKFIEFSLFWEDEISRPKLQSQFGISPQQATKDLNAYQNLAPNNILYNPKLRRYIQTEKFNPKFIDGSAVEYLKHIDALRLEHKSRKEIWIEKVPSYDCTDLPGRVMSSDILKSVLRAILNKQSLEIEYVSLSVSGSGVKRISPHSICTDGNRWHARAYNHAGDRFSDYSLSRISRAENLSEGGKSAAEDESWNSYIEIRIAPDPDIEESRSEMLQIEYEMTDGLRVIRTRKAMLWYILRRLGFNPHDTDKSLTPAKMRNESSFSLVLLNLDEIEGWFERRN